MMASQRIVRTLGRSGLQTTIAAVVLVFMCLPVYPVQVQAGYPQRNFWIGDSPDPKCQGTNVDPNCRATFVYAPAVMNHGGVLDAWFGRGSRLVVDNPFHGDVVAHTANWLGRGNIQLCATYGGGNDLQNNPFGVNTFDDFSLCRNDYDSGPHPELTGTCPASLVGYGGYCGYVALNYLSEIVSWDWGLVNDPAVVKVNGQYFMYWDAPRTGGCRNGVNGQIFLARSSDGMNWVKYPSATQLPTAVIPYNAAGACGPYNSAGTTDKYGIGEPSIVYKDGVFYLYYSEIKWDNEAYLRRATSSDGVTFSAGTKITAGQLIEGGTDTGGGIEVRYLPGWNLWFMVMASNGRSVLEWNISRDGVHWLPAAYRANVRKIPEAVYSYAISPAVEGSESGWSGDGLLATPKYLNVTYTSGPLSCCDQQGQPFRDSLLWSFYTAQWTLNQESAYGNLDGITWDKHAIGWSYDPDAGVNDAAVNGEPSSPLGFDTWVRPVAISINTGVRYEGQWQSAALSRPDLVSANVAPDQYHGFNINLAAQGFPPGTYNVTVEAGEFPVGMGATPLTNTYQVTLP